MQIESKRKGDKKMYTNTYVIENTNDNRFMVVHRECKVDMYHSVHKTFKEAYEEAKVWNFGKEPIDETKHH